MRRTRAIRGLAAAVALGSVLTATAAGVSGASPPARPLAVTWMQGFAAPGTPASYDKVGVIKVGPGTAKNVLVLEPGTSAGSAYFVPLAQWIVAKDQGWQVWSVERRENLLEDQSELNLFKEGKATATQLFDYYLGYLKDPAITHHFQLVPDAVGRVRQAVGDERRRPGPPHGHHGGQEARAARSSSAATRSGARWSPPMPPGTSTDRPGPTTWPAWSTSTAAARPRPTERPAPPPSRRCQAPRRPRARVPWLAFGGITAPYAGLFSATGSAAALLDPTHRRSGRRRACCRPTSSLRSRSPISASTATPSTPPPHRRRLAGRPGPSRDRPGRRRARPRLERRRGPHPHRPLRHHVLRLPASTNVDGTEWYFPQRLTDDTGAVDNGNANPAQKRPRRRRHHGPRPPAQDLLDLRLRRPPRRAPGARPTPGPWPASPASRRAT